MKHANYIDMDMGTDGDLGTIGC